jgi:hypothetical protein
MQSEHEAAKAVVHAIQMAWVADPQEKRCTARQIDKQLSQSRGAQTTKCRTRWIQYENYQKWFELEDSVLEIGKQYLLHSTRLAGHSYSHYQNSAGR